VPIYPHQVADRVNWPTPPNRAIVAYANENDWVAVDESFEFRFSLFANSLIEAVKSDGEVIFGYFKGVHRGTGALAIAPHEDSRRIRGGIGAKTLADFRKFSIDRLGARTDITRETRTWHGVACT
jgi:CRISPR-associated endonuclease Csn1